MGDDSVGEGIFESKGGSRHEPSLGYCPYLSASGGLNALDQKHEVDGYL